MAVIETWLHQDADSLVEVVPLKGNLFYGDDGGNLIGVEVTRAGAAVSLPSGCYGYGILSNGTTEYISGTVSGNRAYVILPKEWCACVGPISIVIKTGATMQAVPNEGTKPVGGVTLAACTGYVYKTRTDTIVDPGSALPDIGQLEAAIANCIAATTNAEKVNVSQSKSGNTITVTTTNRNGQSTNQTLTEPTVSVTKHGTTDPVPAREGDFDITVRSPNASGNMVTNTVTIPNPNAELSDRAHVNTVSRLKTRKGNPIKIEDAVNEIADKMVIKLEPRQDLHGYDKPWVGGAGKNLLKYPYYNTTVTRNGITFTDNGDGTITLNGTSTETTTDFTVVSISNGLPLANGDYILTGILESGTVDSTSTSAIYLHAKGDASESGYTNFQPDVGAGRERTITIINGSMYNFTLRVGTSGVTFTNYKIKLMLRSASNTDASYEPYQNICPITGYDTVEVTRTGKNLFDGILEQGSIDSSTGEKSTVSQAKRVRTANMTSLKKGTYTINGVGVQKCYSYRYTEDGSYDGRIGSLADLPFTFTVDADCKAMFTLYKADGSNFTVADVSNVTIVETESYPVAVSLAEDANHNPAGTVYGGTVTINADGSGTVVVDKLKKTYTSSDGWSFIAGSPNRILVAEDTLMAPSIVGGYPGWSNLFPVKTDYDSAKIAEFNGSMILSASNYSTSHRRIAIFSDKINSVEEFGNLVSNQPLEVVFPAATPVVYELTANQVQTLLGYNYIYTDGAEITLTFRQQILASNDTLLKLFPTGTATGIPATFPDGAEGVPLKNLTVNIEPNQDTHGYGKAWIGGAGKNLFNSKNLVKIYKNASCAGVTSSGENGVIITASASPISNAYIYLDICEITSQMVGKSYTVSYTAEEERVSSVRPKLCYCESDGSVRDSGNAAVTYTILQEHVGKRLTVRLYGKDTANSTFEYYTVQVEEGSSETAFEPYENICPISGWNKLDLIRTKKNMLKNIASSGTVSGVAVTVNEDGTVKLNGTASADGSIVIASDIPIESGKKYALSGCPEGGESQFTYWLQFASFYSGIIYYVEDEGNGGIVNSLPNNMKATVSIEFKSGTSFSNVTFSPMLYPYFDKAEEYEQYSEKVYTVDIPSEAGIVYGGTLTLDQNGEGTLTVDRMKKTYSDSTGFTLNTSLTFNRFIAEVTDMASPVVGGHPGWSNQFPIATDYIAGANMSDNTIYLAPLRYSSTKNYLIICAGQFATLEDFGTWLASNPLEVVMPIASPTTYTLTAEQVKTLLGTNYISCDAGSIDLTYYADINSRIQAILSQINDGTGVSF